MLVRIVKPGQSSGLFEARPRVNKTRPLRLIYARANIQSTDISARSALLPLSSLRAHVAVEARAIRAA